MSSESNFSFTTKINGDLFTVRGDSFEEFHSHLAQAVAQSQALITDLGLLQAAGHATPVVVAAAPPAPVDPWSSAPAPAAPAAPSAFQQAASKGACPHGELIYKEWVGGPNSKAPGKQYKAWGCPTNDRGCSQFTQWVK